MFPTRQHILEAAVFVLEVLVIWLALILIFTAFGLHASAS
jgi:hypothetical protein